MPDNNGEKSNVSVLNRIIHSNITRIVSILLVISLYTLFLSPSVESFLTHNLAILIRKNSDMQVNSLTPLFDIHVYAGEYNLSKYQYAPGITGQTKFFTLDPRIHAMNRFLTDYHSPMAQYAELFIIEADKHGLDWRLIVGISGVESAFGNLIPRGSNNAWGWRGRNPDSRGWSMFETWEEAIEHITERMAIGYGTDLTPFDIQDVYCPPCGETGLDLWAHGVTRFMNELEYYVDNLENL